MHDLRYAIRSHSRTPFVSGMAVLALALGIGASTAVFTVVNGVLLRPLPYADAERVVRLYSRWEGAPRASISPAEYFDYFDAAPGLFAAFGVWSTRSVNVTGDGDPERIMAAALTPAVFAALGTGAQLGRLFTEGEAHQAGTRAVVLSDGLWRRRFGAARDVVGGMLVINGESHTVLGVLPGDFRLPDEFDVGSASELYVPLVLDRASGAARGSHYLNGIARLAPGITLQRAHAGVSAVAARFVQQFPDDYPRDMRFGIHLLPVRDDVTGDVRPVLFVLFAAVVFVLLISCANVASLMLARADSRRRELAVRTALGAGRGRIARQLLVESLLLAGIGGAGGVLLASWGTSGLVALQPANIPRIEQLAVDPVVLGFALATTLLTALLFGLAPLLSWRVESHATLRESGRGTTASRRRQRARAALIVTELALALVLLAGAGLLVRSFIGLLRVDPGYETANVLTVRLSLPAVEYAQDEQRRAFFAALVERVSVLPGVSATGAVTSLPLASPLGDLNVRIEGRPRREGEVSPRLDWQVVTPGYFSAMGIRLARGRAILSSDRADAPGAVVLNETGARTLFPGEDALGKRFTLGGGAGPGVVTVVGVVEDVRHASLGEPPRGEMYLPHAQFTFWNDGPAIPNLTLVARSVTPTASLVPLIRREIAALDADLPPGPFQTMEQVAADSVSRPRFILTLLAIFSGIALLLATIGIYGVVAHSVAQRTHELGIRIALGARPPQVIRMVIGQGARMIAFGIAIGLAGALALTRNLRGLLYDVPPHDPLTLAAVSAFLAGAAILACLGPARRATRADPLDSLRVD